MMSSLPPGWLLLCAPVVALLPWWRCRQVGWIVLPLLSWWHLGTYLPAGTEVTFAWMDVPLIPIRVDRIALVWAHVFHFAALLSAIYTIHRRDMLTPVMGAMYAGSAIAAVCAGDLLTLFVFWELTAVTSVFLIWAGKTRNSYAAGMRYLIVQVGSGVLLLSAAILQLTQSGQIAFGAVGEIGVFRSQASEWVGYCLIGAFGIKAAFPLLHCWLPDAYPESTPEGTVFLSAFTTKLAIYSLLRGFAGWEPLVAVGCVMALVPLIYAVLADDMRRCLAHCLNNQLGFMVVAVGIGTPLAVNGAAAHAVAHILYKGLLFMAAGAILYRARTARISQLGNLVAEMPWTFACYLVGVAAISAPLFGGFVTKSLTLSAAAEAHEHVAWICLLAATAGVFFVCGPRLVYEVFLKAHRQIHLGDPLPANMRVAMVVAAAACLILGLTPITLYERLPFETNYRPYTVPHVVGQLQLIAFVLLTYGICHRVGLVPAQPVPRLLDFDALYRGPLRRFVIAAVDRGAAVRDQLARWGGRRAENIGRFAHSRLSDVGIRGSLAGTGQMAMWAAIMLILYLLLYYR